MLMLVVAQNGREESSWLERKPVARRPDCPSNAFDERRNPSRIQYVGKPMRQALDLTRVLAAGSHVGCADA